MVTDNSNHKSEPLSLKQYKYMKLAADSQIDEIRQSGFATAGNNGPYGQPDTPCRNSAHYLVIYTYLFKTTGAEKYREAAKKLADYLCGMQEKTESGAIQCMLVDEFDYQNGLIGQAWVIEGLLYYYSEFKEQRALDAAYGIFKSQSYDYGIHAWLRVDLWGNVLGDDRAYNHCVWFAACSLPLLDYVDDPDMQRAFADYIDVGVGRELRVRRNNLLVHMTSLAPSSTGQSLKRAIKLLLHPFRRVNTHRLDIYYTEYAYQIFDLYGLCILRERYPGAPVFNSDKFRSACKLGLDIERLNREMYVYDYIEHKNPVFNEYGWSYNCPAFEYPYVAKCLGAEHEERYEKLFETLEALMLDGETGTMTRNNPDIATFDARTYEIVRYLELIDKEDAEI